MNTLQIIFFAIGCLSGLVLIAGLVWSILMPTRRIWPPNGDRPFIPTIAWGLTLIVFGAVIGLGVTDWGSLTTPHGLRLVVGPFLIVVGNLAAWREAFAIGMKATSGGKDELVTTGLYRYSRNPQYVADMGILVGLGLVFSSLWAWPIVVLGVAALVVAPFAEEPWLDQQYGLRYSEYLKGTRRFFELPVTEACRRFEFKRFALELSTKKILKSIYLT